MLAELDSLYTPSTETISLRLPIGLLSDLKELANKRDVPYQSLLKVYLAERVARERSGVRRAMPGERLRPAGSVKRSRKSTRRRAARR
jgi:hypothetical protein